jgi:plasmid stabilization system protein ParE
MILEVLPSANEEMLTNPKAFTLLPSSKRFRRCLIHRFPYGLIYVLKGNKITIVAVMHLARKPGYWHRRSST